ncbi:MAG TPA: hypothetical protein VKX35_03560 [Fermentimonas sp.]|nr:hypothetical protein [Fermentimonas sp.]
MKVRELNFINLAIKGGLVAVTLFVGYFGDKNLTSSEYRTSDYSFVSNKSSLLNEFYEDSWTIGEVINIQEIDASYEVSEIIVGTDTKARGFLVKEENTGSLYLVDVDRNSYIMEVSDLSTGEKFVFTDIDKHSAYTSTNGFDFVKTIPNEVENRRPHERFWGWSCGEQYSSYTDCYRNCCYYIMWSIQGCSEYYCNKLPGDDTVLKNPARK